jgi:2-dehydro-3-deoxyphosphogluconate aldolase / (4S)-4-hydroxy-2-oxoglutarate aldolase
MPANDRLSVYNTILDSGLMPLFYHDDPDIARQVMQACSEGGGRVLEFTNRGPRALHVFNELQESLRQTNLPILLGVGTILEAPTAALYIAQGASFIVGPTLNPEIARLCNRRKIAYIPGCATATEISAAEELGAEIIKVFPGDGLGGPGFIKNMLGPMPWARLMPSGGVEPTAESVGAWIRAGAACVAMGSQLIRKDMLANRDFSGLSNIVTEVLGLVQEARRNR